MPIKDVGFNPEVLLRRFYKIAINFSENTIFLNIAVKSHSSKNQKSCCFFLIYYIMQVTSKLKVEKQLYSKQYVPKLRFYHFSSKLLISLPNHLKLLQR